MRVLLTNDDGIGATGLHALRRALLTVPDVELVVIAPDGNRSASSRSITTRRPLEVTRVDFGDGTHGFACDGTPVDCVRLAKHGLVEGFDAQLIVSGVNHGSNLGDDIAYSGTVAAAFEALILGIGGIAVSQKSAGGEYDFTSHAGDEGFTAVAAFAAALVSSWGQLPLREGTLVNVNGPACEPAGVAVTRLGRRIYREELVDLGPGDAGGRQIRIYGQEPSHHPEEGTDLQAIEDGLISVTPIHFDLTDHLGLDELERSRLGDLLGPGGA